MSQQKKTDPGKSPVSTSKKQAECIRQLRYVHECVLKIVKDASAFKEQNVSGSDSTQKSSVKEDGSDSDSLATLAADFQGQPSQAVQLISMARVLTAGRELEASEVKILTSVVKESLRAISAITQGGDPDRAQEKLIGKLNNLLEMVKLRGGYLRFSPEELLQCSYLRLSKRNILDLEDMIRAKGFEPGIHRHTDVSDIYSVNAMMDAASTSNLQPLEPGISDQSRSFQPVPVYLTKAGAPMDKKRAAKPDCAQVPSAAETQDRIKNIKLK